MKQINLSKKLVGTLVLALLLAACKSTPMVDKPAAVEDKNPTNSASTMGDSSSADPNGIKELNVDGAASTGNNPLNDPNNILSKRSVFFAFDSDAVKAEFAPMIEAHAKYLLANGDAKLILQGNTDDRGTREYNLSLGQRRSVAVKKSLNLLGVQDKQIETISYGEEKATTCSDEACYQAARRADIVYVGE